jgi:hypothetical protein
MRCSYCKHHASRAFVCKSGMAVFLFPVCFLHMDANVMHKSVIALTFDPHYGIPLCDCGTPALHRVFVDEEGNWKDYCAAHTPIIITVT